MSYLYVDSRDNVPSVANNSTVKSFVVVDKETGSIVVDFSKQKTAIDAMSRIIADNPTRDDMMQANGKYMRGVIRVEFGH